MSDLSYKFNFGTTDNFTKWHLPSLVTPLLNDPEQRDELARRTRNYSDIELSIFICGMEVNALGLMENLEMNFKYKVASAVAKAIRDIGFDELQEVLRDAERATVEKLRAKLKEIGIEVPEDHRDW